MLKDDQHIESSMEDFELSSPTNRISTRGSIESVRKDARQDQR